MTMEWDDLDALCREIEEANAEWAEQRAQVAAALGGFEPLLDRLREARREFDADAALELVRARLLGGLGMVQRVTLDFGLEALTTLTWPAAADPRPDRRASAGEYRVEVWLGVNEQQRPRVRIVGAKRLEALLPVTRERFLAALLSAVRTPAHLATPEADAPADDDSAAADSPAVDAVVPATASAEPAAAEPLAAERAPTDPDGATTP